MHDIKFIRENPKAFEASMQKRGFTDMAKTVLEVDKGRRQVITQSQQVLAIKNQRSKEAGEAKARGDEKEFERLREFIKDTRTQVSNLENLAKEADHSLQTMLINLPNSPMDDVPIGKNETDNVELYKSGEPPKFDFEPKEHFDIPSVRVGMDFELAGIISGSRFVMLSGAIARVHRALAQFMLDLHTDEHGLLEVNTPVIVNTNTMFGTGQLPKFSADCYRIHNDEADVENATDHWLIPTAEVPLTNIVIDTILDAVDLPQRYCAHSLCFRQEAGAAGRDTAGMLRQHQFEKVEMVSITHPKDSRKELDRMTKCAETVLERLEIPYRTVVLCTGDMGFSAQRTHDIEVWLPGQKCYREISSVSVCGDFQARRINAQYRNENEDKPQFVHTLNGSGVAVGRCLIAVLENGQQKDGSVKLPKALHPYLGGKDTINPDGILEKAT